jgi:hypothetical protein
VEVDGHFAPGINGNLEAVADVDGFSDLDEYVFEGEFFPHDSGLEDEGGDQLASVA